MVVVEFLNDNAGAVQVVVTATLVGITWWYARSTKKLAKSTDKMAIATEKLAQGSQAQSASMEKAAAAAERQVHEMVQQRNVLERQLHLPALQRIRIATNNLLDTAIAQEYSSEPAAVVAQLDAWCAVMADDALGLPPAVFVVVRDAFVLGDDLRKAGATGVEDAELAVLIGTIAHATLDGLDQYLRSPGHVLKSRYQLPKPGDDYSSWVREYQAADNDDHS